MADFFTAPPAPAVAWQAQEVVRDIDNRPHLLVRVEIKGPQFPHRGAPPFVRIEGDKRVTKSWFAHVADDSRTMLGYFPSDVPADGTLVYGYGDQVWGRLERRFIAEAVQRLDQSRLPKDTLVVSEEYLRAKMR